MNITETISLLDELRGKATQGEWSGISTLSVWVDGEPYGQDGNEEFIIALHNNYEALRQAALDGERYREEAEAGRIVEEMVRSINQRREETKEIFAQDPDFARGYIQAYAEMGRNFAHAYRQAVEQKEV